MRKISVVSVVILCWGIFTGVFAQEHTENGKDQTLRGGGRVNSSTLGMEFDLPLGSYAGRGINVPISLSYSSKVWRMDNTGSYPVPAAGGTNRCVAGNVAKFGEHSAAGWTTSMRQAFVEYTGYDERFNGEGFPMTTGVECIPPLSANNNNGSYVRRIQIHLPSGDSHELRMDEQPLVYDRSEACQNPGDYLCPNSPEAAANWNGWYYAADGSNLRYFEDRANNVYFLQLPDGSKYSFNPSLESDENYKTIRKSPTYVDRNGNQTTYHAPDSQHPGFPHGYWTDTLGRILGVPLPQTAPASPVIQTYEMPGLSVQSPVIYKFHWKKLKGASAADSALSDFNQALKYLTDRDSYPGFPNPTLRDSNDTLFHSGWSDWAVSPAELFNPVLLTAIELPNGQMYRFSYNEYGEIVNIRYPTGGKENFTYTKIPALSAQQGDGNSNEESNRGVTSRKVYTSENSSSYYDWSYGAAHLNYMTEYKVTAINPDGTRSERYLYKARQLRSQYNGSWGYSDNLGGMSYREESFNSLGQLVAKHLTVWTKSSAFVANTQITADYHPRVEREESISYDSAGNGVSTTTTSEYEGNLTQRETPLLTKKSSQYAFVPTGSPLPSLPLRSSESTFLINDANISSTDRDAYKNQNMVGLATVSIVRDAAGAIVSQSEMRYDDSGYSPNIGRGNPTTARVWDSTKGAVTNPAAYIATRARFDSYGNQYEAIDAKGTSTFTEYDSINHAFPVKVTTAAPDASGTNGSTAGFETTATFNYATGLPLTTTDANLQTTTMEYDPVTLRLKKVTPPAGAGISETFYNDQPNNYWVKSKTQIDQNKWAESTTYYDGLGRAFKSEQTDAEGNIFVEKEFDADGRVLRVTNPFRSNETKYWTTNVYDEASRVKEVVLPDGAKVKTDYGVSATGIIGITKQITDQAGKKRRGITDALGRMIRVIEDPAGQNLATDYTFDALGNLRKTAQGEQSRYFSYDSLGRLLRAKQPEQEVNAALALPAADAITGHNQWSIGYAYDDNGNITTTTDARNVSVTGTYDKFNRLKSRDYSDATPDVNFYYDGTGLGGVPNYSKGKTTKVTSSISETRYTSFDNLGRLLTSEQRTPFSDTETVAAATPRTSGYQYNLSGALVTETYPSGRTVTNQFDADGALSSVQSRKNANYGVYTYAGNFAYNTAGAIVKMRLGNGRWETAAYNNRQQVTNIGLGTTDAAQNLLKLDYDYGTNLENNGSLKAQTLTVPTVGTNAGFTAVQNYAYDALNRLQSATEITNNNPTPSWKQTFTYDRYGNRRFETANGGTTTLAASNNVTNPQIDTATNRFAAGQGYSYDSAGNVTQDATGRQFAYDAENHQKEVKDAYNAPLGTYLYDGEGKRVKKISNSEIVVFVYNGGGTLVAEYSTALSSQPQVSYLTTDYLGSPRIITNENGAVTKRQDYTAFGEETITANRTSGLGYTSLAPTNDDPRQGYTGYQKDDESGLDYAQARYYNSAHGRFTSVDPLTASATIKNPQTFNRYSYVLNSPYKFTDPLGLLPQATRNEDGSCGADNSDCSDDLPAHEYTQEVADAAPTDAGVADSHEAAHSSGTQQEAEEPEPPPTNPNAPVPGSGEFTAPTFSELAQQTSDITASGVITILKNTFKEGGKDYFDGLSNYERAVFVNTVAGIVDAGVELTGVEFKSFYFPGKDNKNPSGITLSGVTKENLNNAGLKQTGGDLVGLILRPFLGRRSPGNIKTASVEATVKKGDLVSFDIDLYNARAGITTFVKHQGEVSFNNKGATTHPADVSRALRARKVISGVTTQ